MRRQNVPTADGTCYGRLARLALILLLAAGSALAQTQKDDSLAEFEERVKAAFAEVESALASQRERLDDLATDHTRRTLADGRPSVAQAAANIRLWEQRIRELEAKEGELEQELDNLLAELALNIAESVQRLVKGSGHDERAEPSPESIEPPGPVPSAETSNESVGGDATAGTPRINHAAVELSLGLDRSIRALVQMGLTSLGFDAGPVDGLFGGRTRSAISSWQSENDHQATGHLTRLQADALIAAGRDAEQEQAAERERREQERIARQREEQRKAELERAAQEAMAERQRQQRQSERKQTPVDQGAPGPAAGEVFRDCPDCPEMVVVTAGSFRMGGPHGETGRQDNEGPQHRVKISQPYAVSVYEVTREQYLRFVIATGRTWADTCITYEDDQVGERRDRTWQTPGFQQTDRHPVVCVSWYDAHAYGAWLSSHTGKAYRLLSESEWEHAARGGTSTARYWGESESEQCRHANGLDSGANLVGRSGKVECRDGHAATSPVGTFTGNPFGVYDVLGNVWEWTQDCWTDTYDGVSGDGRSRQIPGCQNRVIRGGSWSNGPTFLRSARRDRIPPDRRFSVVGFRIGLTFDRAP
ncbi:MAG: SUMF1/EgtB/PvdO family nonheme iron enzyme [Candidatus Tectomicrobia bacterium]|nr:SUMF1/EgtB/PvdO family nonheme iron enzyme [Candidatus Tectomicrobia bacterium]